jgi:hypothetical protein
MGEDWTTPLFTSNIHPFVDDCYGHNKDDLLVWGDLDGHAFTNGQYYDYMNPKESNLPYVYDNFEWKHCAALGFDIANRPGDEDGSPYTAVSGPDADAQSGSRNGYTEPAAPPAPAPEGTAPPAHADALGYTFIPTSGM